MQARHDITPWRVNINEGGSLYPYMLDARKIKLAAESAGAERGGGKGESDGVSPYPLSNIC